jgi:hypothetical protein
MSTYASVIVRVVVPVEAEELVLRPLEAASLDDMPLPLAGLPPTAAFQRIAIKMRVLGIEGGT